MQRLRRLLWLLLERCSHCGGRLWEYDDKRAFCEACGRKD
jgi:hypothetical protein